MSTVPAAARLIAELLEPQPGMSVYDPGSGSGRLLRVMEQHARAQHGDNRSATVLRLFGRELDPLAFSFAAAMFAAARIQATITLGDSLRSPALAGRGLAAAQFDRVVLNPTWGQATPVSTLVGETERRFPYGLPPADCADWAWVQHGLAALAPAGRMAVVLDAAALSRESERHIRAAAVKADLLDAVIVCESTLQRRSPPARIVAGFLERAAILVFDRAKRHPGETMFIDAGKLVFEHPFDFERLIREVAGRARRWRAEPALVGIARRDEIALRRHDLRPRFYISHRQDVSTAAGRG
jgi:type I restriction enzyme M protein